MSPGVMSMRVCGFQGLMLMVVRSMFLGTSAVKSASPPVSPSLLPVPVSPRVLWVMVSVPVMVMVCRVVSAGGSVAPALEWPQQATVVSVRMAHAWMLPTATSTKLPSGGSEASPLGSAPQHTSAWSVLIAQAVSPPAATAL